MIDLPQPTQEEFFSWLKTQVPSFQLSEYYFCFQAIESFALKTKLLEKSVFKTNDIQKIAELKKAISNNLVFKFQYRKQMSKVQSCLYYYCIYLKEINNSENISHEETVEKENLVPSISEKEFALNISSEENSCTSSEKDDVQNVDEIKTVCSIDETVDTTLQNEKTVFSNIDFTNLASYAFTRPVSFTYFENKYTMFTTWTALYVEFFKVLISDYPKEIQNFVGKSFSNNGRIDLNYCNLSSEMVAPKQVSSELVLETNLSANSIVEKIRRLLDVCLIDYENVTIQYVRKKISDLNISEQSYDASLIYDNEIKKRRKEFLAWLSLNGVSPATAINYVSLLRKCSEFANRYELEKSDLLLISNAEKISDICNKLFKLSEFCNVNIQRNNSLKIAITKYSEFCGNTFITDTDTYGKHNKKSGLAPYEELLCEKFPKGFKLNSTIEIKKIKHFYQEKYGNELEDSDALIPIYIQESGIKYEDRVYSPKTMLCEEVKSKLLKYIENMFLNDKSAIYFDALFQEFSDDFLDQCIYDANMLKTYLTYINQNNYFVERNYITKRRGTIVEPIKDVRNCMVNYAKPILIENLYEMLPHIPSVKIKQILHQNKEFVYNAKDEYFHSDILNLDEEELSKIIEIINIMINDRKFITFDELKEAISQTLPEVVDMANMLTDIGFRDALSFKLRVKYSFSGNIISKLHSSVSNADVFEDFCLNRDELTLSELNSLKNDLNTNICFDNIYSIMLRVSEENFVSKSRINFPIKDIDEAIGRFCTKDYISLKEIPFFASFPNVGFQWNSYLLEQYVYRYSDEFRLLHTCFNANSCVGAIVRCSSPIKTFDDLIIDLLSKTEQIQNVKEALNFLCESGYLARRIFGNINKVYGAANAIKVQRGNK